MSLFVLDLWKTLHLCQQTHMVIKGQHQAIGIILTSAKVVRILV